MKRTAILLSLFASAIVVWAQGPCGTGRYYEGADGAKGKALKKALFEIIKNPDVDSYDQLWTDFKYTDRREDGFLWDMYSNATSYEIGGDKQGATISVEGSSYNREHSLPKSWFKSLPPMYSDLMHILPVDGRCNSVRNNFPYGENDGEKQQSTGGFSKLGACTTAGYTKTVFEPNDEYKGDLARIYFYMATCYEDSIEKWSSQGSGIDEVFTGNKQAPYADWMMSMLLRWSANDPVSQKEVDRNMKTFLIQRNRNPFVDYPGLEKMIWGDEQESAFSYDNYPGAVYGVPDIGWDASLDASAVAASVGTQTYQKIDYAGDLTLGASYLLVSEADNKSMSTAAKFGANYVRDHVDVTISDQTLTTDLGVTGKPYELILGGTHGDYTLYDPVAKNYVALTSDANQLHTSATVTDNARWRVKFEKGNVYIYNKVYPKRSIYYNQSSPRFATYANSSQYVHKVQLYKNIVSTSVRSFVYSLDGSPSGIAVYTLQGTRVRVASSWHDALQGLPRGIYLVNGRKYIVR